MKERLIEVSIKNLRLRAIIGLNEWEQRGLQDVIISVSYRYDALEAIKNDDISLAFDYKVLTKKIITAVENSKFKLLESLTDMIYNIVSENSNIKDINVVVEKPHSLRFCDTVSVRIYDHEA